MSKVIDLQDSAINSHWEGVKEDVSAIISNMQNRESWTLDDRAEFKNDIVAWGGTLDEATIENIIENCPDELIRLISFSQAKRSLYFLQSLESIVPGVMSELLFISLERIESPNEDVRHHMIFRDRLVALFRVDLLDRIFSVERTKKIHEAISKTVSNRSGQC